MSKRFNITESPETQLKPALPEFLPLDILCCVCRRRIQTWKQYTFFYAPHHTFCLGQLQDGTGQLTPAGEAVYLDFLKNHAFPFYEKWSEVAGLPLYDVTEMIKMATNMALHVAKTEKTGDNKDIEGKDNFRETIKRAKT